MSISTLESAQSRRMLDQLHVYQQHDADDAEAFQRERAEAEAALKTQFLLAASLGNAAMPVAFVKPFNGRQMTVADIVFEAISADLEFQREAMQLILTLARGDCTAAADLLRKAATGWAEQNAEVKS